MEENWFEKWFSSPYYKLLYSHRNESEAAYFLERLLHYLNPPKDSTLLDLACGSGRHAVFLADKGFEVTGIDLSTTFIEEARSFEHEHLSFFVHDMRDLFKVNCFDYIFNFFTSFGYFEKEYDNFRVLNGVSKGLKDNGVFVLDYLNVYKALETMVRNQTIHRENIEFKITKSSNNNFITKEIDFEDDGVSYHFEENVGIISLADFEKYFQKVDLDIIEVFGDYALNSFDYHNSDRLIIIAKKIND